MNNPVGQHERLREAIDRTTKSTERISIMSEELHRHTNELIGDAPCQVSDKPEIVDDSPLFQLLHHRLSELSAQLDILESEVRRVIEET